jgi:predicted PurR-regulated permease PerM
LLHHFLILWIWLHQLGYYLSKNIWYGFTITTAMKTINLKYPFYIKATLVSFFIGLLCLLIYTSHNIIFPVYFSLLLAIVLHPPISWLIKKGVPNVLSIIMVIFLSLLLVTTTLYLLISQVGLFAKDLPQLEKNFLLYVDKLNAWLQSHFHVTENFLEQQAQKLGKQNGGDVVAGTLLSITDIISNAVLVPVYTFLILYYRKLLMKFLLDVFDAAHSPCILNVVSDAKKVISSYIVGLVFEMIVVTALNALGLWLVGAKYIFLLAIMAAILNLIPYIGMIIASIIGVLITMSYTTNLTTCVGVVVIFNVVQILDNNFIFPMVVGGKVKVNAIMSIIGVLIGNALGGITGMFLSIPTIAVLKVAFDNIDHLKPWGMLLGDDIPVKYLSWRHIKSIWQHNNKNINPTTPTATE